MRLAKLAALAREAETPADPGRASEPVHPSPNERASGRSAFGRLNRSSASRLNPDDAHGQADGTGALILRARFEHQGERV